MSEVINTNKYLTLDGLRKYDGLIKEFIASGNQELANAIELLNAKIGNLEFEGSDDKTVAEIIEDIYGSIATLVEKDGEIETIINGIIGELDSSEGTDDIMTLVEITNKLNSLESTVAQNGQKIVSVTERVAAVEEAIKDLGEIEGGENLGSIVNKVNLNVESIKTLTGDGEGSVKKTAQDAADAAQSAAQKYADGLASNYDAAGTAEGFNTAMDARVAILEAIDHEQLAADASAAAVAAIVAGAESDFDTLKDVEEWIGAHKEGAAELQTTVSNHTNSINELSDDLSELSGKVEEDITNLATHMTAADAALAEVDSRLDALEAVEAITDEEIASLFA